MGVGVVGIIAKRIRAKSNLLILIVIVIIVEGIVTVVEVNMGRRSRVGRKKIC